MATPVEETPGIQQEDGELVTEFPPPPYYYELASSSSKNDGRPEDEKIQSLLTPPPIPYKSLERASMKAVEEMNRKREEAERNRLEAAAAANANANGQGGNGTGVDIGGGIGGNDDGGKNSGVTIGGDVPDFENRDNQGDDKEDDVAVFGEYVEDPLLSPVDDCADPKIVKEEIFRLNKEIVHGFVKLVRDLVERPVENKKSRDELSHNIFLMLQECNKFREHQAREIFIETLETQLKDRQNALAVLNEQIEKTDTALEHFERIKGGIDE